MVYDTKAFQSKAILVEVCYKLLLAVFQWSKHATVRLSVVGRRETNYTSFLTREHRLLIHRATLTVFSAVNFTVTCMSIEVSLRTFYEV